MKYDVIIIGGGPAGMMAAIAMCDSSLKTAIIEHGDKVGRKILVTGNGKCNLTNMNMGRDCYNSDSDGAFYDVIENYDPNWLIGKFCDMGMLTRERDGYVYPASEQASTVLDTLRNAVNKAGCDVISESNVKLASRISDREKGFIVSTDKGEYTCDKLILACGSKCYSKTGSDGFGYKLARYFGHRIIDVIPALGPIECSENFFPALKGVRAKGKITISGYVNLSDRGEIQFTEYGISGIPVFQLSRHIIRAINMGEDIEVELDLYPDHAEELVKMYLDKFRSTAEDVTMLLNSMINKKLAVVIANRCKIKPSAPAASLSDSDLDKLCDMIKHFKVSPVEGRGYDMAQVCAGGVDLEEIDTSTMESLKCKGLYICGEMLDVDGICGGYNLHWAFASGYLAGLAAAGIVKSTLVT